MPNTTTIVMMTVIAGLLLATPATADLNKDLPDKKRALECPTKVTAFAKDEGIHIDWRSDDDRIDAFLIERDGGDGFKLIATLGPDARMFLDTDVEEGETFRYRVVPAAQGELLNKDCPVVEATAIPFFPGLVGAGLAVMGSVAALRLTRRK